MAIFAQEALNAAVCEEGGFIPLMVRAVRAYWENLKKAWFVNDIALAD